MNIIGIGNTGCYIAQKFEQYKHFKVFKINNDLISEYKTPEEYELKYEPVSFDIEDELTVILSGEETINGMLLRFLEQYKNVEIKVLYVKPDVKFLTYTQKAMEKVVYNVLQEYTRSARIKFMSIVDLKLVSDIVGKVSLKERQDKIYSTFAASYYMKNMFENIESAYEKIIETPPTYCITSLGIMNFESGEETLFYPIDNVREKVYYYYINKETLNDDTELFEKIEEQINNKFSENVTISFAIFESPHSDSVVYIEHKSPYIQA
jgi:hypothetical protein